MTYRFNNDVLVINEETFFVRQKINKVRVSSYELTMLGEDYWDSFTLPQGFNRASLKQNLEAWLNGEYESKH